MREGLCRRVCAHGFRFAAGRGAAVRGGTASVESLLRTAQRALRIEAGSLYEDGIGFTCACVCCRAGDGTWLWCVCLPVLVVREPVSDIGAGLGGAGARRYSDS